MNIGNMAKGMNDVERFSPVAEYSRSGEYVGKAEPNGAGGYVRYTDYAEVRRLYQAEISALQQQLSAAREALALFVEFDDAGEPPGDVCFEKARATLQRDRQP